MPLRDQHLSILWPIFPVLIALSLWFGVKAGGDNLLRNRTALSGIGSLERARTLEQAQHIIKSWDQKVPDRSAQSEANQNFITRQLSNDGRMLTEVAKRSLVFDLFFIFFYTSVMAVACLLAATEIAVRRRKQESRLVGLGIRLAFLQVVTAGFDVIENLALWRMLSNSTLRLWPLLAYICSIGKYTIIAICLVYYFIAFMFWAIDHRHPTRRRTATA